MASFFSELADGITKAAGIELFQRATELIEDYLSPLFLTCFSIYLLLIAWGYMRKGLDDSIMDLSKSMIGWLLIIALALNAGNYMKLANLVYSFPDELVAQLAGGDVTQNIVETQIQTLKEVRKKIETMMDAASSWSVGTQLTLAFADFTILALGLITILVAFVVHLLAKVSLALVLALGPLFMGCLIFPSTRQYGMNWIGQILNYSIVLALYSLIINFHNTYLRSALQFELTTEPGLIYGTNVVVNKAIVWEVVFNITILSIVFIPIILSVPSLAAALTGGASLNITSRGISQVKKQADKAGKSASQVASGAKAVYKKLRGGNSVKNSG